MDNLTIPESRKIVVFSSATIAVLFGIIGCYALSARHVQAIDSEIGGALNSYLVEKTSDSGEHYKLMVKTGRYVGARNGFVGEMPSCSPRIVVESVTLEVGGKQVPIPVESYRCLANVAYGSQVQFIENRWPDFSISGGDGFVAFTANFEISHNKLARRVITWHESEAVESVTY